MKKKEFFYHLNCTPIGFTTGGTTCQAKNSNGNFLKLGEMIFIRVHQSAGSFSFLAFVDNGSPNSPLAFLKHSIYKSIYIISSSSTTMMKIQVYCPILILIPHLKSGS